MPAAGRTLRLSRSVHILSSAHQVVYVVAVGVEDALDVFLLEILGLQDGQSVPEPSWVFEVALDLVELQAQTARKIEPRGGKQGGVRGNVP